VRFELNPFLVRGLDYYAHTCFEFRIDLPAVAQRMEQLPPQQRGAVPAQATVLAGGRYDGLFKTLGGPVVPAVGWAAGDDRLLLLTDLVHPRERQGVQLPAPKPVGVVLDREGAVTDLAAAEGADASAQKNLPATETVAEVSLDEAYAALCTFVRDGCVLPTAVDPAAASVTPAQSLHAPLYSVVQSFHPNVWKQLKAVTKPAASASTGTAAAGDEAAPAMAAVLILGPEQLRRGEVQFRDQQTREQYALKLADLRTRLRAAATGSANSGAVAPASDEALSFERLCSAYRSL